MSILDQFPALAEAIAYQPAPSEAPRPEIDMAFLSEQLKKQDEKYIVGGNFDES